MTRDMRFALFRLGEMIAELLANEPELFKCWLNGGVKDLGARVVDLQLDYLTCFKLLNRKTRRAAGLRLSMSLK